MVLDSGYQDRLGQESLVVKVVGDLKVVVVVVVILEVVETPFFF